MTQDIPVAGNPTKIFFILLGFKIYSTCFVQCNIEMQCVFKREAIEINYCKVPEVQIPEHVFKLYSKSI